MNRARRRVAKQRRVKRERLRLFASARAKLGLAPAVQPIDMATVELVKRLWPDAGTMRDVRAPLVEHAYARGFISVAERDRFPVLRREETALGRLWGSSPMLATMPKVTL